MPDESRAKGEATLPRDPRTTFEVLGRSTKSFSAATADAVANAGALFARIGWGDALGRFEVLAMRGPVEGGKRTAYEIRIRVGLAEPAATTTKEENER